MIYVGEDGTDQTPRPGRRLTEIATLPLIRAALAAGKTVCCPLIVGKGQMEARRIRALEDLQPGRYGILEPRPDCPLLPPTQPDLLLTPGWAFDLQGRRLGRGGGYYDRYLAAASGLRLALIWPWQLVASLPVAAHDLAVDVLVSELGAWRTGPRGPQELPLLAASDVACADPAAEA